MYYPAYLSLLLTTVLIFGSAPALASNGLRTVAITGAGAPGVPTISIIDDITVPPVLNDRGHSAFFGYLAPREPFTGLQIIVDRDENGPESVAAAGQQAPGTQPRVEFEEFPIPFHFSNSGRVALGAFIDGPGVGEISPSGLANHSGLWSDGAGTLELVVRSGDIAVGDPLEMMHGFPFPVQISEGGDVTFFSDLAGDQFSPSPRRGIWKRGVQGVVTPVVISGQPAAGLPDGVAFGRTISFVDANDAGQVAFTATLQGNGVTTANDRSVWAQDAAGQLQLLAREGDPAPGLAEGHFFNDIFWGTKVSNGQHVMFASISGPLGGEGIWRSDEMGGLESVILSGERPEGLAVGENYLGAYRYLVNRQGRLTQIGLLGGAGVTSENDFALLGDGLTETISVIAREGQQAPDVPAGVVFDELYDFERDNSFTVLNALGQTAFSAELRGPGVTSNNDRGIWAQGLDGQIRLIAREGDQLDVSDDPSVTDLRTIRRLSFYGGDTGNDDGRPSAFNDAGRLAFSAGFTDGSEGAFISDLVATLSGDYNNDGNVDGSDLLAWQRGESPNPLSSDDLNYWQTNYGVTTFSPVSSSVPEPSPLPLALVAALLQFSRRQTCSRCILLTAFTPNALWTN